MAAILSSTILDNLKFKDNISTTDQISTYIEETLSTYSEFKGILSSFPENATYGEIISVDGKEYIYTKEETWEELGNILRDLLLQTSNILILGKDLVGSVPMITLTDSNNTAEITVVPDNSKVLTGEFIINNQSTNATISLTNIKRVVWVGDEPVMSLIGKHFFAYKILSESESNYTLYLNEYFIDEDEVVTTIL